MKTKLFTTSALLATLFFSGCGGGTTDSGIAKQPHDTSKLGRTVAIEKDWTWDVSFSLIKLDDTTVVQAHFWEGVPKDLKNFQVFVDLDNDENTGYSGSDGWEIHGADYLIENGQVYKSQSTTQWKWEYIDLFKDLHLFSAGVGKYGKFDWRTSTAKIDNIFNADSFKVMIEAYDANWKGDCNTITGIVADVSGVGGGINLSDIESKIRKQYNSKYVTVTTIDFAPDQKEAIVMMISKWAGKKMYLINTSNVEKAVPIALEYERKFIYKTNVVKGDGIVEFQVKEDDGLKYQVVYDYKNDKEISKTLITENIKKVLVKKEIDKFNDGTIDSRITYKYDSHGNVIEKDVGGDGTPSIFTNTYNDEGKLIEVREDMHEGRIITKYDLHGNPIEIDNGDYVESISYKYAEDGRILETKTEYSDQQLIKTLLYMYDENNNLTSISKVHLPADKTFTYNSKGQKLTETIYSNGATHKKVKVTTSVYSSNGELIMEKIDDLNTPDIDTVIYYEWGAMDDAESVNKALKHLKENFDKNDPYEYNLSDEFSVEITSTNKILIIWMHSRQRNLALYNANGEFEKHLVLYGNAFGVQIPGDIAHTSPLTLTKVDDKYVVYVANGAGRYPIKKYFLINADGELLDQSDNNDFF